MNIPVLIILYGTLQVCTGGRILYLAPIPSKSHYILSERLVEELGDRGHEVIVVAPFKRPKPVENVEEIVIPDMGDTLIDKSLAVNTSDRKLHLRYKTPSLYTTPKGIEILIEKTMTHQPIMDLLNSEVKIDLVVGISASVECLLAGFAHRFKAPMVVISTSALSTPLSETVGNPAPTSYVPDAGSGFTDHMNFSQRFVNLIQVTLSAIAFYLLHLPRQDYLMRKYFGEDVPPLKELLLNNSLVLVNHHFGLGYSRPYLPNVIEIGGYHIRPTKPLPKDLRNFMDEATDGVIYFNIGSRSDFPTEKFDAVLRAFSNLTQRVLWKFGRESTGNLPENVRISKWLPQSDILAHPNMKLFITHGGLLSLTESIYRGVPIVGIPIYPDQSLNVKHIENLNVGVGLDLDAISEESMSRAIQEILNNTMYSVNAKLRSEILRDRPLPPIDTAVYWLEYVMKYKGAPHLRSGAQHLAWYQLHLLDVFLLLVVILVVGIFLTHKFFVGVFTFLREAGIEEKLFVKKTD